MNFSISKFLNEYLNHITPTVWLLQVTVKSRGRFPVRYPDDFLLNSSKQQIQKSSTGASVGVKPYLSAFSSSIFPRSQEEKQTEQPISSGCISVSIQWEVGAVKVRCIRKGQKTPSRLPQMSDTSVCCNSLLLSERLPEKKENWRLDVWQSEVEKNSKTWIKQPTLSKNKRPLFSNQMIRRSSFIFHERCLFVRV